MEQINFYSPIDDDASESNYNVLHVSKMAEPKLRKAIISNCKKELVNSKSECILNVLNGNVKLSDSNTRKLRKHKATHTKVSEKRVPLCGKKKLIVQRGAFLLPLLNAVFARDRQLNIFGTA